MGACLEWENNTTIDNPLRASRNTFAQMQCWPTLDNTSCLIYTYTTKVYHTAHYAIILQSNDTHIMSITYHSGVEYRSCFAQWDRNGKHISNTGAVEMMICHLIITNPSSTQVSIKLPVSLIVFVLSENPLSPIALIM